MIVHHGQVKSITLDEIEGAYKIATIHVGHPSNFLWGWEGLFGRSGGVSDCEELVPNFILNGTKEAQFSNLKEMNYM